MSDYNPTAAEIASYVVPDDGAIDAPTSTIADNNPTSSVEYATELETARHLVRAHGDCIRFDVDLQRWLVWTGRGLEVDHLKSVAEMAKQTARSQWSRYRFLDSRAVERHASRMETAKGIAAVLQLASSEPGIPIRHDVLDADPWLFNCQNAVIDMRTGRGRRQQMADMLSIVAPVDYDAAATAPTWARFLERIFDSNAGLIAYVSKLLGMCLTGDVSEQLFHVFHGSGANGKSTLLDTVLSIMGEYAGAAPDSLLTLSKYGEHPTELAGLLGKRLIEASETEDGAKLRIQMVKKLTGDLRLSARFMRGDYFQFSRTFKVLLITNNPPKIDEDTEATRRRIRMIPFDVVIPVEERDPDLAAKLLAESSGILNWLIEGCLAWQRDRLKAPSEVDAASASYFEENDRGFADFIAQCTMQYDGGKATRAEMFTEYERHCQRIGERNPMTATALYERVRRLPKIKDSQFRRDDRMQRGFEGVCISLGGAQ